jgi:isocitrate/isopropylmalate dehydrogenase
LNQIGLVTGGGTGPELAHVFRGAVEAFSKLVNRGIEIALCPHEFRSFTELEGLAQDACRRIVEQDVRELARFYQEFHTSGGRHIFRTAVNAETLYTVRRELQAVKVSHEILGHARISFFRDQFQGFYSNDCWRGDEETITFQSSFSKAALLRIYRFARAESAAWLGPDPRVWFVYKHHLFANAFVEWIADICPHASVLQPGMAYSKLNSHSTSSGRPVLLIAGNEIGDMLQEIFIGFAGRESRETACSRNVYLHPTVTGLEEYQTVHGSADDIAGLGRVNPIGTLRAAAAIFDAEFGIQGISAALERAIQRANNETESTQQRAETLVAATQALYDENNASSFSASAPTLGGRSKEL